MSKVTIYSQACYKVMGFQQMSEKLIERLVIDGKSKSAHQNYIRQIAKLALYYEKLPLDIEIDELEEYLFYLIQKDTDALSSYKQEAGQDIMTLKDLLGHADVKTTLIYLHIAQLDSVKKFGCLDVLYNSSDE